MAYRYSKIYIIHLFLAYIPFKPNYLIFYRFLANYST